MATLVLLALGSIVFFSTIMIVMALMLRGRWDKLSPDDRSRPSQSPHRREQ